jgi:phosphate-selective porin OprO/OprP
MQYNIKSVIATLFMGLLFPVLVFAHAEQSMPVESGGGLSVGSSKDPYWFELGGELKLDQTTYTGNTEKTRISKAGTYQSGAFIRALGLGIEGGVGNDFTYTIEFDFDAQDAKVEVDYAYLTYHGLKHLAPNFTFSIGQVASGFCIHCASSGKWLPFRERNMGTSTFGPQQGMGISANSYDNNYSVTVAATQQPRVGKNIYDPSGNVIKKHDLWQSSARITYAPIAEDGRVLQFGLSSHIQEYSNTGLQFSPAPEMRSGNSTTLLNTTNAVTGTRISAKNQKTIDLAVTGIYNSWSGEVEYQKAYVARGKAYNGAVPTLVAQGKNLRFSGYHAQVSYVLTGEFRPLKRSNGTLGQIKPRCKSGAWEVSGRYSVINLNSHDIFGGKANNTTASLSWYANDNVRVIGDYVFSKQKRQFPTYLDSRHVNGVGARLQVVF